jgi:ABC-type hemin transport system ATPase subunit
MTDAPTHLSREESDALAKRRRARNLAVLAALLALTALFYAITVVRMGAHPA